MDDDVPPRPARRRRDPRVPLLTTEEVATVLRRESTRTVCRLIAAGKLAGHWTGSRWLVHPDDLAAYLAATRWRGRPKK